MVGLLAIPSFGTVYDFGVLCSCDAGWDGGGIFSYGEEVSVFVTLILVIFD